MSDDKKAAEPNVLPPPTLEEIRELTDGGLKIYEALVPDLAKGKMHGLRNPMYNDTNGSMCIYCKAGNHFHRDWGKEETNGGPFKMYRAVRGYEQLSWLEVREKLSQEFLSGQRSKHASEKQQREELEQRQRERQAEERKRQRQALKDALMPQRLVWAPDILIKRDQPTAMHQYAHEMYGRNGLNACALYGVMLGEVEGQVVYPITDTRGNINAIKPITYRRTEDGRITKKGENGKPMYIRTWWPPGLQKEEQKNQLFGAHLIHPKTPRKTIAILESEDAAIIAEASQRFPGIVFMASKGKEIKREWIEPFKKHKLLIIPDADAAREAEDRAQVIKSWGFDADARNLMAHLSEERKEELFGPKGKRKADLKDYLHAIDYRQP
jgi:hypothetical protein